MRYILIVCTAMCLIFINSCSNQKKEQVGLIVHNATIYTVDEEFAIVEAAAISDGVFVAIGSNKEILGTYKADKATDLKGMFVYPGLIDPHAHFFGYGVNLMRC